MYLDSIFPQTIEARSTLSAKLTERLREIDDGIDNDLTGILPQPLIDAEAFLDKMTNLWRYEFGIPYEINGSLLWGTQMWVPIDNLIFALRQMKLRLTTEEQSDYLSRLNNPQKHLDALVEMVPAQRLSRDVQASFEVKGLGEGKRTIDWLIELNGGRQVLIDVKRRDIDFIKQIDNIDQDEKEEHDHFKLFRSLESKFIERNSQDLLQGAWIVTSIKQDRKLLPDAFIKLNRNKIHFVILGDWESDALLLTQRDEDRNLLLELFNLLESERFYAN